MAVYKTQHLLAIALATATIVCSSHAQLLDDDFDNGNIATGGTNGGFQLTDNGVASAGSSTGETGTVGTVTTGGGNNNAGLYSVDSVDLASQIGFEANFIIDSVTNPLYNNGLMLGITEDATTFYRSGGTQNFGIILGSQNYGVGANDLYLVSNDSGGGVIQATILEDVDLATAADGFTASFTVWNNNTYSYQVTGLSGTGSASGSGTLSGGISYASQFDNADHAFGSLQSGSGGSQQNRVLGLDRVTIGAPALLPSESITVSDLTTPTALDTVNTGVVGTYSARGRSNDSENDRQVATFMNFDTSVLTPGFVNSADFEATFEIDLIDTLNTVNNAALFLGRNASGDWDTSGTDNPLHDWAYDDETNTVIAQDVITLISNLKTLSDPEGDLDSAIPFTADVTDIVKGWVNGDFDNQGLVLFLENGVNAGGFENAQIRIVPEPSSLVVLGLGGLLLARRRRS